MGTLLAVGFYDALVGDPAWVFFTLFAAFTVYIVVSVISSFRRTGAARQGKALVPVLKSAPVERVRVLEALADDLVESVTSAPPPADARVAPGFSESYEPLMQRLLRLQRSTRLAAVSGVVLGGGLALVRLTVGLLELAIPAGAAAAAAAFLVPAVLAAGVFVGRRAWFRSAASRRRLLARMGAGVADERTSRSSIRALEQVAAGAGLATPPTLYIVDAPVLNAAVMGASERKRS